MKYKFLHQHFCKRKTKYNQSLSIHEKVVYIYIEINIKMHLKIYLKYTLKSFTKHIQLVVVCNEPILNLTLQTNKTHSTTSYTKEMAVVMV